MSERSKRAHANAKEHGFWPEYDQAVTLATLRTTIPTKIALIHSEVSEALEAYRKNGMIGFGEELADIIIRTEDLAEALGYDIDAEIEQKMKANESRPFKHGGRII